MSSLLLAGKSIIEIVTNNNHLVIFIVANYII